MSTSFITAHRGLQQDRKEEMEKAPTTDSTANRPTASRVGGTLRICWIVLILVGLWPIAELALWSLDVVETDQNSSGGVVDGLGTIFGFGIFAVAVVLALAALRMVNDVLDGSSGPPALTLILSGGFLVAVVVAVIQGSSFALPGPLIAWLAALAVVSGTSRIWPTEPVIDSAELDQPPPPT